MTVDFNQYIDQRNRDLWEVLSKDFCVSVVYSSDDTYSIYNKGKIAIIYVPADAPCKDSFTHELLHLYLWQRQVFIGSNIKARIDEDPLLSCIITPGLVEHISNCLDHIKMLPIYLKLGFTRTKFISDYELEKCTDTTLDGIQYFLQDRGTLWSYFVDQFIGKFIGMKACPNDEIDYSGKLARLKEIDAKLFEILDDFWRNWENFDIEVNDPIYNPYDTLSFDLVSQLKEWVANNRN